MLHVLSLIQKQKTLLIYGAIIALAFFLRGYHYWEYPLADETADEIAWTWLGSSLLENGQPASWSYYPQYQPEYILQEGPLPAPIVQPALDHPPLFSFLPGVVHSLTTSEWEVIPSRKVIRVPMILLGTLAVLLFAYWSHMVLEKKWSMLATLLYATVPSFIFASRLVVAENLLVIWILAAAIVLEKWRSTSQKKHSKQVTTLSIVLIILSIAAVLTKIAGIILPVSICAYALLSEDKKLLKVSILGLMSAVISLGAYAALYNFPLFLSLQTDQAGRGIGLTTLYSRLFIQQNVVKYIYFDGWIILSLFGFLFALLKKERTKIQGFWLFPILITVVSLGFIGMSVGEYTFHGWYNYTFYPFLPLFATTLVKEAYHKKFILVGLLWILLLPSIKNALFFTHSSFSLSNGFVRTLYLIGFVPLFLSSIRASKKGQIVSVFLFASIIISGIITVLAIDETGMRISQETFYSFVKP